MNLEHLVRFNNTIQEKGDWIIIKPENVYMDLNEVKKKHTATIFDLTNDAPQLATILKES